MFEIEAISKPALFVDMDKALANLQTLVAKIPSSVGIRLSTKSIRCPDLIQRFATLLGKQYVGVMCYHPAEIPHLLQRGCRNIVLAYPNYTAQSVSDLARALRPLAADAKVLLMVDDMSHLQLLDRIGGELGVVFSVCVDIDVSTRFPGLHFGVKRSPLITPRNVRTFIESIAGFSHLKLAGLMSYEAQLAGISDRDPRIFFIQAFVQRLLKSFSRSAVRHRRLLLEQELADLLRNKILVLNGGGSGSTTFTAESPMINEITIGSGILCPSLFEYFDSLSIEAAIFFGLPVVRCPDARTRTLYSGGYMASGSLGKSKQPRLFYPKGWSLTANEGLGEVQSPIVRTSRRPQRELNIGDVVYFVPAKSGEVMERFSQIHLVSKAEGITIVNTYRGEGLNFG